MENTNIEGMYNRTQISSDCVKWIGGDYSTLTGGYGSTLTGGDWSILTGGDWSILTGGNGSILNGGYKSTLTGGNDSILNGGYGSTLMIRWWDGDKNRISIAYVGENGILPNVPYKLNSVGEFVVA